MSPDSVVTYGAVLSNGLHPGISPATFSQRPWEPLPNPTRKRGDSKSGKCRKAPYPPPPRPQLFVTYVPGPKCYLRRRAV